ncbi:MAG: NPXTG-anchored protein [Ruminococcus sp.]|nr:NPXTG-anchored protein [Ruminococcus sp.]
MKLKSVFAAFAAALAVSAVSVCGFAETANSSEMTPAAEASDAAKENPDTGVESVAAFAGAISLAGAAIVISRKRD